MDRYVLQPYYTDTVHTACTIGIHNFVNAQFSQCSLDFVVLLVFLHDGIIQISLSLTLSHSLVIRNCMCFYWTKLWC